MNLTPFQGFLAAMADSQFSAIFYVVAIFQIALLVAGFSERARRHPMLAMLVVISQLILPTLLAFGVYYATRPIG